MNMKRLQIAYACDDNVFNALYLSILSTIKRTKSPIDFYVFTADLTNINTKYRKLSRQHAILINRMIKKYNKKCTFNIIDSKSNFLKRLNGRSLNTKYWTPFVTFRLLFDMFPWIKGQILYMDTDTLVCDDISKIFNINMNDYEMSVTKDIITRFHNNNYFNAGVILLNIDKIRKTKLLEHAFDYLLENKPKYCDQDALNMTVKYLNVWDDDRFNRIYKKRLETTVIKHFAGLWNVKPWTKKFEKKYDKLNYRIWEQDILEWKEMKSKL